MSAISKVVASDPNALSPSNLIAAGDLNPQQNGFFTLTINSSTGDVLSVQPDGSFQTRPKGTAGPWELCGLNGNALVFCPEGKEIFTFYYFDKVPNV